MTGGHYFGCHGWGLHVPHLPTSATPSWRGKVSCAAAACCFPKMVNILQVPTSCLPEISDPTSHMPHAWPSTNLLSDSPGS
jgi:hypothetical protein